MHKQDGHQYKLSQDTLQASRTMQLQRCWRHCSIQDEQGWGAPPHLQRLGHEGVGGLGQGGALLRAHGRQPQLLAARVLVPRLLQRRPCLRHVARLLLQPRRRLRIVDSQSLLEFAASPPCSSSTQWGVWDDQYGSFIVQVQVEHGVMWQRTRHRGTLVMQRLRPFW